VLIGGTDPLNRRRLEDLTPMTHVIAEPCIGTKDASCVDVCPVDCIHPTKDDDGHVRSEMLFIDPDTCIDCGLCVDECPVQAIFPEEDLPAEWIEYVELNRKWYEEHPV
jgi:NAD-dependent dihydropyrimidine dehydrogenase PreA subunit